MADDQRKEGNPFAPSLIQFRYGTVDNGGSPLPESRVRRRQNCIKCCGCVTAILAIQAVVALVLVFTVLNIKDPVVNLNNIELSYGALPSDKNTTLLADVSIKNPNVGPFKTDNGWLTIYRGDRVVGQARISPVKNNAKATVHMNVTVEINRERLLAIPSLRMDAISGALSLSTSTIVRGEVRVIKIIRKHVEAKDNCNVTYNILSHKFQVVD